jgi:hypothetical protein
MQGRRPVKRWEHREVLLLDMAASSVERYSDAGDETKKSLRHRVKSQAAYPAASAALR